ncbi:hypothetical protein AC249_AIPGENE1570 [Exaiptasia diaphana]|nr:hypothetical protein AC249_AIPGENE1570 [Exaiptasia diaphana]
MAFSSDGSAFTVISKAGNVTRRESFNRISDVKEELSNSWNSSIDGGKIGRSSVYKKTVTKKQTKTVISKTDKNSTDKKIPDDKGLELVSSKNNFDSLSSGSFFKAKYKDMDGDDFFRSASSRFSMRNINDTSGWNFDLDEGASLFPDFFPKNDAATKLSFEATWRSASPVKEIGLAKQAIKNCSWEDDENKDAKHIVNSWMQFFGHVNPVKNG